MSVFHFRLSFSFINDSPPDGGFGWSETRSPRKPDRHAQRWYSTDSDVIPLGPFPAELKALLAQHWAITRATHDALPLSFDELGPKHFTGLQKMRAPLAEVFAAHAGGAVELVPIPQFWSLSDKAEIAEPYFIVNVHGTHPTIDLESSAIAQVRNPRMAQPYFVTDWNKAFVTGRMPRKEGPDVRHVWRDTATSDWFCDSVFRDALEKVSPGRYAFTPMRTVFDRLRQS